MRADLELLHEVETAFASAEGDVVFVHSNVQRGFAVERPRPFTREAFLATHFDAISYVAGDAALWFPTFNYDYCDSRVFDLAGDRSQVGHLSEHVRTKVASWRSIVPVFSITGTGPAVDLGTPDVVDPFGAESAFAKLRERKGTLFNYGVGISTLTFLHYCESMANELPYRYPKQFPGHYITSDDQRIPISVCFHVRPLGQEMTYDWDRLEQDLRNEQIIRYFGSPRPRFQLLAAEDLAAYWIKRMNEDPLYLLSPETRAWVEPKLETLGRAFVLEDFEPSEMPHHG